MKKKRLKKAKRFTKVTTVPTQETIEFLKDFDEVLEEMMNYNVYCEGYKENQ